MLYHVSIGRTALHSCPVQIRWEDLQEVFSESVDVFTIQELVRKELQGVSPQQVLCINEDKKVEFYLQFHVLKKQEAAYPQIMNVCDQDLLCTTICAYEATTY